MKRRVISLGGWCGPALMLGKLGHRTEAYPLDFSRCTLDGIIHFLRNGFHAGGFYPPGPPPYRPECVGIWVLFRGQHTAFAHFDLNSEQVRSGFERKMERWDAAFDGKLGPLNLFRTVTARDPREELALIPELERTIQQRCPSLDFRLSVVVHDQGLTETTLLQPMSDRTALWALEYGEGTENKTLFDRAHDGYQRVVATMVAFDKPGGWPPESLWPPRPCQKPVCKATGQPILGDTAAEFPWRCHDNIALIDGIASVAGTCTGIGSTTAIPILDFPAATKQKKDEESVGSGSEPKSSSACVPFRCAYCGSEDGHRAGRPDRHAERTWTQDEDEVLVAHLCKILVLGSDRVEAVESIAHELGRGSYEVVCRLQHLTNSSLKLTDGLEPEDD